jgi:predicted acetyltransferase
MGAELVRPSAAYESSFRAFSREAGPGVRWIGPDESIEAYLTRIEDREAGRDLPENTVAESIRWLVDDGEVVGLTSIRHTLDEHLHRCGGHIGYHIRASRRREGYGSQILPLALDEAHALGISPVLLTCDNNNEGSRKIIERNGGRFDGEADCPGRPPVRRYWFD